MSIDEISMRQKESSGEKKKKCFFKTVLSQVIYSLSQQLFTEYHPCADVAQNTGDKNSEQSQAWPRLL